MGQAGSLKMTKLGFNPKSFKEFGKDIPKKRYQDVENDFRDVLDDFSEVAHRETRSDAPEGLYES